MDEKPEDNEKEFLCNVLLSRALLQFLPVHDRTRAQEWLRKLLETEFNICDGRLKIEYALYLLMNIQSGTLSPPFNKPPPAGKIRPLDRILPEHIYEEVMKQMKVSYCRMSKMLSSDKANFEMPDLRCDPVSFENIQPRPQAGVQAHCAVFSSCDESCDPKL